MSIPYEKLLDVIAEASYRLSREMKEAYKKGILGEYLLQINMQDLLEEEKKLYDSYPNGKVIIIGASRVSENEIIGCVKECGISKDRLEMWLGYNDNKKTDFRKLQYNPNYRLILFGPLPHSGIGKEDNSSIITNMENSDGYTKIARLTDGHTLKITKSNIKNAIIKEIKEGYLEAS